MTGEAKRPIPNSYWVIPRSLAAGEYPGAKDPIDAASKVRTLLCAGITHFIDLTEAGELVAYAEIVKEQATNLGISAGYERHPIIDVSVPRYPRQMSRILDSIDHAMRHGKIVYVHCWGGVGRTGTVVGCWLVRHGCTGEEALRQIAKWWRGVEKAYRLPISPETPEQHEYVREWTELSKKGGRLRE